VSETACLFQDTWDTVLLVENQVGRYIATSMVPSIILPACMKRDRDGLARYVQDWSPTVRSAHTGHTNPVEDWLLSSSKLLGHGRIPCLLDVNETPNHIGRRPPLSRLHSSGVWRALSSRQECLDRQPSQSTKAIAGFPCLRSLARSYFGERVIHLLV